MDLNAMFQNLGPAGGSLLTGMQMADATNEQRSQEAMRKAQMDEIMQRTAQNNLMNPLELQAKQQAISSADMKAKQEKNAYRDEILTKAIPEIEKEPALRRHARLEEIFTQAGLPLDQADRTAFYNMNPDELVKNIKAKHEFNVKNAPDYMKAMAQEELRKTSHLEGIREQGKNQIEVARIGAVSRENAAAAKNQPGMGFKEFNKLLPKVRISVITKALADGIDPVTGSELKEDQRAGYAEMLQKDTDTLNAELASKQPQGVVPQVENGKVKLINKSQAQVGKTKNGVAYTVLPPQ